jgi:predicted RNase H-like HicB family nuclease
MTTKTFTAVVHQEDDLFVADCPEVGTVSQGKSVEEAIANLKEATELHLETFPLKNYDFPWFRTFEAQIG